MKSKISNILGTLLLFAAIAIVAAAIVLSFMRIFESHAASKDSEFTVTISARLAGSDDGYHDQLSAPAGSEVELKIGYTNCSNALQNDVAVWADLPEELEYVNDTTRLFNMTTANTVQIVENTIADKGLNIGTYSGVSPENETGGYALIYLTVRIPETTTSETTFTPTARIGVNGICNTAIATISTIDPLPDPTTTIPGSDPTVESSPEDVTETPSPEESGDEPAASQPADTTDTI